MERLATISRRRCRLDYLAGFVVHREWQSIPPQLKAGQSGLMSILAASILKSLTCNESFCFWVTAMVPSGSVELLEESQGPEDSQAQAPEPDVQGSPVQVVEDSQMSESGSKVETEHTEMVQVPTESVVGDGSQDIEGESQSNSSAGPAIEMLHKIHDLNLKMYGILVAFRNDFSRFAAGVNRMAAIERVRSRSRSPAKARDD